eukprot:11207669-Lingulodinium_polyedra.AAC.1
MRLPPAPCGPHGGFGSRGQPCAQVAPARGDRAWAEGVADHCLTPEIELGLRGELRLGGAPARLPGNPRVACPPRPG